MPFTNPFRRPKKDKPQVASNASAKESDSLSQVNPMSHNGTAGKVFADVVKPQLLFHAQVFTG